MKCSRGGFSCGGVLGRHRRCSGPLGQGDAAGGRALGKSTGISQSIILASGSGEASREGWGMLLGEQAGAWERLGGLRVGAGCCIAFPSCSRQQKCPCCFCHPVTA